MGPRDRLPPRHDAFSSAHLAQPSYMTRSGRQNGDFKTACAHGRIQYCNTTFCRIAPLGCFLLPSCALVFTRTLSISKCSRCHFSSTPSFHYITHKADCKVPGVHAHVRGEDVQQNSARRRRAVSSGCMWGRESFSGGVCPKGGKRAQSDRHGVFIPEVGDMKLFS